MKEPVFEEKKDEEKEVEEEEEELGETTTLKFIRVEVFVELYNCTATY